MNEKAPDPLLVKPNPVGSEKIPIDDRTGEEFETILHDLVKNKVKWKTKNWYCFTVDDVEVFYIVPNPTQCQAGNGVVYFKGTASLSQNERDELEESDNIMFCVSRAGVYQKHYPVFIGKQGGRYRGAGPSWKTLIKDLDKDYWEFYNKLNKGKIRDYVKTDRKGLDKNVQDPYNLDKKMKAFFLSKFESARRIHGDEDETGVFPSRDDVKKAIECALELGRPMDLLDVFTRGAVYRRIFCKNLELEHRLSKLQIKEDTVRSNSEGQGSSSKLNAVQVKDEFDQLSYTDFDF